MTNNAWGLLQAESLDFVWFQRWKTNQNFPFRSDWGPWKWVWSTVMLDRDYTRRLIIPEPMIESRRMEHKDSSNVHRRWRAVFLTEHWQFEQPFPEVGWFSWIVDHQDSLRMFVSITKRQWLTQEGWVFVLKSILKPQRRYQTDLDWKGRFTIDYRADNRQRESAALTQHVPDRCVHNGSVKTTMIRAKRLIHGWVQWLLVYYKRGRWWIPATGWVCLSHKQTKRSAQQ